MNHRVSTRRTRQAAKHPYGSGFPSAICSQKAKDLALGDHHRNVVNRDRVAKTLSQPIQRNNRISHASEEGTVAALRLADTTGPRAGRH